MTLPKEIVPSVGVLLCAPCQAAVMLPGRGLQEVGWRKSGACDRCGVDDPGERIASFRYGEMPPC